MGEGGTDAQQANLHAVILPAAVNEQRNDIENDAQQTDAAQCSQCIAQGREYVDGAQHIRQKSEEEQQERTYHAHGEDHRQEMYELETLWILLVKVDAGETAVVNLSPEFAEVGAALMLYPCFREQTATAACLEDTDREIDVLTKTHVRKAIQLEINIPADAHVE